LEPALTQQMELALEQFRGLCFECVADRWEFCDAPGDSAPEWAKHLPPIDHAARLVRLQGTGRD
jgi:hypothetical protein